MDAQRLGTYSRRHGGVFTRREAQHCGFSPKQIRRRLRSGEWVPVIGQVLAPSGVEMTPYLRDTAAHLAVGGSVLAGPSAARRWRFPVSVDDTYLYVGAAGRSTMRGAHLLRDMPDARDLGTHGIVPVTWREQTIVDCLRILPEPEALELLDRALLKGWITMDGLIDRIQRRTGRRGIGGQIRLMRQVLDGTRSAAERMAADLFRQHGIAGWVANAPIHDADGLIGRGDFVFDRARLVLEVDGWAFHQDLAKFVRDRERQNRLVQAGWTILRVTWYDLRYRPGYVVNEVRKALAGAR